MAGGSEYHLQAGYSVCSDGRISHLFLLKTCRDSTSSVRKFHQVYSSDLSCRGG